MLVLFLMTGLGLVGFLDDYIKIVKQRSLGPARPGQDGRPDRRRRSSFAIVALQFADADGLTPASTELSFVRDFGWPLGPVLFVHLGATS